ncbi:MAG: thioredoxin domain-containing protein [Candidatus Marinimicrobia bacterium]|nr:thioredoxin domain-containing protein [Candidatus Neomarinimicrobiota bacterium]
MIEEIRAKYPNDVKVVIKNFPLSSHKQANKAAIYALAAHRQGKYHEMFIKIMENYRELRNNEDLPLQYAVELGLDINQLKADMEDPALQQQIGVEVSQLQQTGLRMAVPKFLINGKEPPKRDMETWSALIEGYLK